MGYGGFGRGIMANLEQLTHIDRAKRHNPSHLHLVDNPSQVGAVGEDLLEQWLIDNGFTYQSSGSEYNPNGGDNHWDFKVNGIKLDSKYNSKTYRVNNLLVLVGKVKKDTIYIASNPNGFMGCASGKELLKRKPWTNSIGNTNHAIPEAELHTMEELAEVLRNGRQVQ